MSKSITVKKLIKLLSKADPHRQVILASDSEGNSYSPLATISEGAYKPSSKWAGEVGLDVLDQEAIELGHTEDDVLVGGKPALILYPHR